MTQPQAPQSRTGGPPAGRYGRRDPVTARRRATVGGVVFAALLLAWAGWMGWRQPDGGLRWQAGTFTAVDDGQARLELVVTLDPGRTAVCTVRMFNSGLTEVGRKDLPIGPSPERTIRVTATVPTFEKAATGRIRACAAR